MPRFFSRTVFGSVAAICLAALLGAGCPSPTPPNGTQMLVSFGEDLTPAERASHVMDIKTVLDQRMRAFHFAGHEITPAGEGKLLVKLPGVHTSNNPQYAQMVAGLRVELARRGTLEFRLVHPDDEAILAEDKPVPEGYERVDVTDKDGNVAASYIMTPPIEGLATKNVTVAEALPHKDGSFLVSLQFDEVGSAALATVTEENIDRKIAMLIDGRVYNIMGIGQKIDNGQAAITGINSKIFAVQLTIALSSGELPVDITVGAPETYGTPPTE